MLLNQLLKQLESTKEQLRDYVKASDYKTDKDGIVERLNTAEAERITLKGEIKDKVTLNEYQSGLAENKKYSDEQDKIRELEIKAYADGVVSQEEQRAIMMQNKSYKKLMKLHHRKQTMHLIMRRIILMGLVEIQIEN